MNTERIKEIQYKTGLTKSHSVYSALLQVWNEVAQGYEERLCAREAEIDQLKQQLSEWVAHSEELREFIGREFSVHEADCRCVTDVDRGCNCAFPLANILLKQSPSPELLRKIKSDAIHECADFIRGESTNRMLTADNEQFYIDCAEQVYNYADKLESGTL